MGCELDRGNCLLGDSPILSKSFFLDYMLVPNDRMNKYKARLPLCALCILILCAVSVILCVDIYSDSNLHIYAFWQASI